MGIYGVVNKFDYDAEWLELEQAKKMPKRDLQRHFSISAFADRIDDSGYFSVHFSYYFGLYCTGEGKVDVFQGNSWSIEPSSPFCRWVDFHPLGRLLEGIGYGTLAHVGSLIRMVEEGWVTADYGIEHDIGASQDRIEQMHKMGTHGEDRRMIEEAGVLDENLLRSIRYATERCGFEFSHPRL